MYGRFALMAGLFLGSFPMTSCDDDAVTTEYQPLPKLTLDEPFQYECTDANLVSFTPDSLTRVAVLNFLKEDVTDLDYVDYDEQTCMFTFRKGELSHYRITWEYGYRMPSSSCIPRTGCGTGCFPETGTPMCWKLSMACRSVWRCSRVCIRMTGTSV